MYDFGNKSRIVIDLKNMKSNNNHVSVDPSHLYIIGFWTYGGHKFKIKNMFPTDDPNATWVDAISSSCDEFVDVYNIQGALERKRVPAAEATLGLPSGIYIVNGQKILWNGSSHGKEASRLLPQSNENFQLGEL